MQRVHQADRALQRHADLRHSAQKAAVKHVRRYAQLFRPAGKTPRLKLQRGDGAVLVIDPQRLVDRLIVGVVLVGELNVVTGEETLQPGKRIKVKQGVIGIEQDAIPVF